MNLKRPNLPPAFSGRATAYRFFCFIGLIFLISAGNPEHLVECSLNRTGLYKLGSGGINSTLSIQFAEINEQGYDATSYCEIAFQPPENYGLTITVLPVENQKISSINGCEGYVEVFQETSKSTKICFNESTAKVIRFSSSKPVEVIYNLNYREADQNNGDSANRGVLEVIATAFRIGNALCGEQEYLCRTGDCIWDGLICDGVANCEDLSDEKYSKCDGILRGKTKSIWSKVKKIKFKPRITSFRNPNYSGGSGGGTLSTQGTILVIGIIVGVIDTAAVIYALYKIYCARPSDGCASYHANSQDHLSTITGSVRTADRTVRTADITVRTVDRTGDTEKPPSYFEVTSAGLPPFAPTADSVNSQNLTLKEEKPPPYSQ